MEVSFGLEEIVTIITAISVIGGALWAIFKSGVALMKHFENTRTLLTELTDEESEGSIKNTLKQNNTKLEELDEKVEQTQLRVEHTIREVFSLKTSQALGYAVDQMAHDEAEYAVWHSDAQGNCLWVNLRMVEWCGMERSGFLGNGWVNIIHPEDRDMVFNEWNSAVVQDRDFVLAYRFQNVMSGEIVPITAQATAIKDSKGRLTGYIAKAFLVESGDEE